MLVSVSVLGIYVYAIHMIVAWSNNKFMLQNLFSPVKGVVKHNFLIWEKFNSLFTVEGSTLKLSHCVYCIIVENPVLQIFVYHW